ncbi:MAG TPA: class I SAM-dependent methyltransferase [Dehalococcoidia bacterium]|nr:class I SAM-dependent methyltransferase [Dehalococcoidia bacterium]
MIRTTTGAAVATRVACPACGTAPMQPFFRQGAVPVFCNVLHATADSARRAPRADIALGFCRGCGMVGNVAFEPQLVEYAPGYENSQLFSPAFRAYAESMARDLVERHDLDGRTVVDIGCGQGEFLSLLCEAGAAYGLGFDPSFRGTPESPRVAVVPHAFTAESLPATTGLVCCRHVLEHVADPLGFLRSLRRALDGAPDTPIFFEVPNGLSTLRDLAVWDVIYEHCSYFTAPSLRRLFERSGFAVEGVWEAFGGQMLCLEARPSNIVNLAVTEPAEVETLAPLVEAFAAAQNAEVGRWSRKLRDLRDEGRSVVVWGAGSKGVTFVNVLEPGLVMALVDVSPRKRGRYVACVGLPVVGPDDLRSLQPDVAIVMNPQYASEVSAVLTELGLSTEVVPVAPC